MPEMSDMMVKHHPPIELIDKLDFAKATQPAESSHFKVNVQLCNFGLPPL